MDQNKLDRLMMESAKVWASASHSERLKVGSVVAVDGRIISTGYNGTPAGFSNVCEIDGVTVPEAVHAEENAILFCAKNGLSTSGATLYTTISPCFVCAKMILVSGIRRVVYEEEYRDLAPLTFLDNAGVQINCLRDDG